MAKKVYAPPAELPAPIPDYKNYDMKKEDVRADKWLEELKAHCRAQHENPNEYIGEIIRHHVADGYAQYMIFNTRPFILIHIPLWDAYRADEIWENGINLTLAKKLVAQERAMQKLFAKGGGIQAS